MENTPTVAILVLALLTAPALAGGITVSADEPPSVWLLEDKVVSTDVEAKLGTAIATENGAALVGVPGQAAVRVLEDSSTGWETVTELEPNGYAPGFGYDVALDRAAQTAAVGAWLADEVYVFQKTADGWSLASVLSVPTDGCLGSAVDIDPDGDRILAADRCDADAAYVFKGADDGWYLEAELEGEAERFAWSVALVDGHAAVGTLGARVTIFERTGDDWTKEATVTAGPLTSGRFADAIDMIDDQLVVGDPSADDAGVETGGVHTYRQAGSDWELTQTLFPSDLNPIEADGDVDFGAAVDVDERLVVGAPGDDRLPGSIRGASDDGGDPACSLPLSLTCHHPGAAYVFDQGAGGEWQQSAKVVPQDARPVDPPRWFVWTGRADTFGTSVAQANGHIAVGAPSADWTPMDDAGAAYLYTPADEGATP